MHRTTLALDSSLERQLRLISHRERRSLKDLINDLLHRALKAYSAPKKKTIEFTWHVSHGKPVPGFDPSDRSTYLDLISRKFT